MGIRIHKDIGYFISIETINDIFVEDFDHILAKISKKEEEEFWDTFPDAGLSFLSPKKREFYDYDFKQLAKDAKEGKTSIDDLIKHIFFYDDLKGYMLFTPELSKMGHYDDLIDYYEDLDQESTLNLLHRGIYPYDGYVYHGGLENHPQIHVGINVDDHLGQFSHSIGYQMNKELYDNKYNIDKPEQFAALLTDKKYFHPRIPEYLFCLTKALGIIQPHITHMEFNSALEPAIAKYWC